MKRIKLTKNKFAIVDDKDFKLLNKFKWYAYNCGNKNGTFYAARSIKIPTRKSIIMHRVIMRAPKNKQVDHINGNGLDNRRKNLRLCTQSQNNANSKGWGAKTGLRGVRKTRRGRFQAYIKFKGYHIPCGNYKTKKQAAIARDKAAKKFFGNFARLNFPKES